MLCPVCGRSHSSPVTVCDHCGNRCGYDGGCEDCPDGDDEVDDAADREPE
jgi:hypothetical protein